MRQGLFAAGAARELLDAGTTEWWTRALRSVGVVKEALRGS